VLADSAKIFLLEEENNNKKNRTINVYLCGLLFIFSGVRDGNGKGNGDGNGEGYLATTMMVDCWFMLFSSFF
jgi:hypothetical protein